MNKRYIKSILLVLSMGISSGLLGQSSVATTLTTTHINNIYTSEATSNNYNLKVESDYNSTSISLGENITNLNFRKDHNISSSIIMVLSANSSFVIIGEYNGWYEIDYNGVIGYVSSQYVKIINSQMIENVTDIIGITTNLTASSKLNLRNGPGTDYTVSEQLPTNSAFKVLFKHGDWYAINYNGTIGYVYGYYVHILSNDSNNDGVSSKLVDFTALKEGFSSTPYKDATGHWTVGFGENYGNVYPGSETYSDALINLINNLENFKNQVKQLTAGLNLNQDQLNALTDFAFNLGINSLKNSRLLKDLKSGVTSSNTIKSDFQAWSYGNSKFLQGLYNRRTAEANMFLYGQY